MKVGMPRELRAALTVVAATVVLGGCVMFPGPRPGAGDPGAEATPPGSASPTPTDEPAAPSAGGPVVVVLDDDEVTQVPQFIRSTPRGSWPVGVGIPAGFPAGVPVIADRWIKNNVLEFDSDGRYGYSAMFWGGYDHVDALVARLEELGFDVEEQRDDTKRVIVADSDRYRVVINATETAQNPGEQEFIDPAYTTIVVFQP